MTQINISNDRFVRVLILNKVTRLIRSELFLEQDREDLIQDFYMRCIESLKHYDTERGHHYPFLVVVVNHYHSNLVRTKLAARRTLGRVKSLAELVHLADGDLSELADFLSQEDQDRRSGTEHRLSEEERFDLAMDVEHLTSKLPEHLVELLRQLEKESLASVVRESKMPQSTTYSRLYRIARTFQAGGLKNYLEK